MHLIKYLTIKQMNIKIIKFDLSEHSVTVILRARTANTAVRRTKTATPSSVQLTSQQSVDNDWTLVLPLDLLDSERGTIFSADSSVGMLYLRATDLQTSLVTTYTAQSARCTYEPLTYRHH